MITLDIDERGALGTALVDSLERDLAVVGEGRARSFAQKTHAGSRSAPRAIAALTIARLRATELAGTHNDADPDSQVGVGRACMEACPSIVLLRRSRWRRRRRSSAKHDTWLHSLGSRSASSRRRRSGGDLDVQIAAVSISRRVCA
jgi:hypothetical protein